MAKFISYGNPGLFDNFIQNLDVAALNSPLMRVGKIIDWEVFRPTVMAAVNREAKGPGGRPRFHPLFMFKVLVLQRVYNLADDALSFQIADRCSFRAFLGLTTADQIPDGQTIRDFREALNGSPMDQLFQDFLDHLRNRHNLALAEEGVIIDASFAQVPQQRNSREENAQIKEGVVPERIAVKAKVRAHKDLDARWTKKNQRTYYGYKNHVKVDAKDKLILKAVVTPANVHDSQALESLIEENDKMLWADSAYSSEAINKSLDEKKMEYYINEKGRRGHPLNEKQKASNRSKSKIRSRVEHVFGHMRGSMKALYQRYIGLQRNEATLKMTNLVYNMMRFEQIQRLNLGVSA